MSQWGAQGMATRGAGYREILSTFYPGTELTQLRPDNRARAKAEPEAGSRISDISTRTDIKAEGRGMANRSGARR